MSFEIEKDKCFLQETFVTMNLLDGINKRPKLP